MPGANSWFYYSHPQETAPWELSMTEAIVGRSLPKEHPSLTGLGEALRALTCIWKRAAGNLPSVDLNAV